MGFLRTGEPLTKMIYLIFNIVVSIILSKSTVLLIAKIGTKEDEESGLLMGFWRSLSGHPVFQIAASRTLPVNCIAVQYLQYRWSAEQSGVERATGRWAGQRSSGVQEVGPLTPPPPALPPPSAQTQRRARKG